MTFSPKIAQQLHPDFFRPRRKPLGTIDVDWSDPISRDLVCAVPFNERAGGVFHNLASPSFNGALESGAINPSWSVNENGMGFSVDQNGNNARNYGIDFSSNPATGSTPRTVFLLTEKRGTSDNNYLLSLGSSVNNTGEEWRFRYDTSNGNVLRIEIEGSAYASSLVPSVGQVNALACSYGGGNLGDHVLYLNGQYEQASGASTLNTGADYHFLCADPWSFASTASAGSTDVILLYLLFLRQLSHDEISALTENPWRIFRPTTNYFWVPAPATGGTSINATTDTLIIAEQPSTVKADTSITAGQDTLTIAEQPATIKLSSNVSALTDTLTITEQSANISLGASINATTDTLTITEQPSVIVADTSISANIDTLTITSFSAPVSTGEEVATKGGQTTREQRLRKERVEKEKERLKKEATETPEFLKRILAAPTEEEIKVVQEKQEELVQEVLEQSQEISETKIIEFPKKKESFKIPKDEQIEILRNLSIVVASQKIMLQQMQKQMEIQNQLISKILEMKYVTEDEVIAIVLSLTA